MLPTHSIRIIFFPCLFTCVIFLVSSCTLIPSEPSPAPLNVPTGIEASGTPTILASQTLVFPTETASPTQLVSPQASPSSPSVPSETPTSFSTPDINQVTPLSSQVQAVQFAYELQTGSPKYLPNITRPSLGCGVQSVAGQVFDQYGNPVKLLVVNIRGVLNGKSIDNVGITGNTTSYGPGGYEVDLGIQPYASTHSVYLWLTDLQGSQISGLIYFDTYADCQKNLIILNFQVNRPYKSFFPWIMR